MSTADHKVLLEAAWEARERANCRYSKFAVGAALHTKSGRVFTGSNVESSSYGLSCCAERVALFTALAAGESEFDTIAVVAEGPSAVPPCGACRQLLYDYAPELLVVMGNGQEVREETIGGLLPYGFSPEYLEKR